MPEDVEIKVTTKVDPSDLDKLNTQIKESTTKEHNILVKADTSEAESKIENITKITRKAVANDKGHVIGFTYNVEGDDRVYQSLTWAEKRAKKLNGETVNIKIETDLSNVDDIKKATEEIKKIDGLTPKVKVDADDKASEKIDKVQTKIKETTNQENVIGFKESGLDGITQNINGAENATGNFHKTVASGDGAWNILKNSASGAIDSVLGGLESATSKMSSFLGSMSGAERIIGGALGAVGVKSINDLTLANAKAADTNKLLMNTMSGSADAAKSLWDASDKATNTSLMSMRELVPTMSAFQSQTGASAKQMELFAETASKLGSKSLALGYSSERTTTSVMALGNALDGAYAAVDHLGITEQTLKDTGLWDGKKEDVEGFLMAVQEATGDVEGLMTGIEGKEKKVFKNLSTAGRKLGEEITPVIERIYDGFLGLNKQTDGWVAKLTVGAAGAVSTFAMVAPQLEASFNLFGKLSEKISTFRKGTEAVDKISKTVGGGSEILKHTAQLSSNTSALSANTAALTKNKVARTSASLGDTKGITQLGKTGAAAGAAAPGVSAGATGFSAISSSISSMLVPLLAISAVIAIMIPIVAGIVAEILIFTRLIGELVKALGFEKLKLEPAIDGIKQIGLAMWELGRAFSVMLGINILNVIYMATGGIIGTGLALGQFWLAMKGVEAVLKDVNKLNIDPSAVTKINNLSAVLKGIADATNSMSRLNLAGLGTLLTGGIEGVKSNVKNIEEIGKSIQEMDIPSVNDNKISLINKLSEVVKKLSEASKAVDDATGWFNEKVLNRDDAEGMKTTLDYLKVIADNINNTTIPTVKEDKVGLVKKLSEVVKPLSEASKAVDDATGFWNKNVLNIDDVKGMKATLTNLGHIATNINSTVIPPVSDKKIEAVKKIKDVIMPIVDTSKAIGENAGNIIKTSGMSGPFETALDTIYKINQKINSTAFGGLDSAKVEAINALRNIIKAVAGIGLYMSTNTGNLTAISDNKDNLSDAIDSLEVINQKVNSTAYGGIDESKVTSLENLKQIITKVGDIGLFINQNTGNLAAVSENKTALSDAIQALYEINQKFNSTAFGGLDEAKIQVLTTLKSMIQTIANTLSAAANVQPAAQNMGSKITTGFKAGTKNLGAAGVDAVKTVIDAVKNRYATMQSAGNALGEALLRGFKTGSTIGSPMQAVVSGLDDTINHIRGLADSFYSAGSKLGESFVSGLSDEEIADININDAIKQNSGSIMDIFRNSGIKLGGGAAGSPFEEALANGYSLYPSGSPTIVNNFNGLITERDTANFIIDVVDNHNNVEATRS